MAAGCATMVTHHTVARAILIVGGGSRATNPGRDIRLMTRLIVWSVAATAVEVAALAGVVHTLLRYAMTARGLPVWRLGDTLLTSPLLWIGATVVAVALNCAIALVALRAGRHTAATGGLTATVAVALVGMAMAWFGLRAVGKLY